MKLVVLGTDTGVGKTLVSALIARRLARDRHRVKYWKPVASGLVEGRDSDFVASIAPEVEIVPEAYAFDPPIAPHLAAAQAGARISLERLCASFAALSGDHVVVEGVGGVLVPLTDDGVTFADLVARLALPAVVVARTALGTINHTLLTLEALRARGVSVLGVVLSGEPCDPAVRDAIARIGRVRILAELPWASDVSTLDLVVPAIPAATDWMSLDRAHVWRPYTAMKIAPPPLEVVRAEGVELHLADGRRIIDAIGSWWVNVHGHGHPRLVRAMADQAATIDQIIYASCAHEPGARLAGALARLTGLPRVFYSDDGSTAVEAAIKIAHQSFTNRGIRGRNLLIALEGAYHGDTLGAMSASATGVYHKAFEDLMFDVRTVPPGDTQALRKVLEAEGDRIFALIVEPIVQGAAGMQMYDASFLRDARDLCTANGVPLIADEVFTGFGRTGRMFACEHAGITPDLMCLSKALTGGVMPMGATLATEALFEAFSSDDRRKTLFHGHSYTGNAIACRVALESLALLEENRVLERVRAIEARCRARLTGLPGARVLGAIAAFDLPSQGEGGYLDPAGARWARRALDRGVLIRPLGDVVYVTPPFSITDAELDRVLDAVEP